MQQNLPSFNTLDLTHFTGTLDALLNHHLSRIQTLAKQPAPTWENLIRPLESMDDALEKFFSPLSHLHAVINSDQLRQVYQTCLPKLSMYHTQIGQNKDLFNAIQSIDTQKLNLAQQKIINDMLRDFKLSGVALAEVAKKRFEAISTRLSDLANQFDNHVLDATQAYTLNIEEQQTEGLPEHARASAKTLAKEKSLPGYVLTLEAPCYLAVMSYANDRALRQTYYHAYITRASNQGPFAGKYDNTPIMDEILDLRNEKATLLGFPNYAALSLATKMAQSTEEVTRFLLNLVERGYPKAQEEFHALQIFAREQHQIDDVKPWDVAWLSEKMKQHLYDFSEEELRPYFPQDTVLSGLFEIVKRLYGMRLHAVQNVDTWHPDVVVYQIIDETNTQRGTVYLDLYARPNKRGGAWMDSLQSRCIQDDGNTQLPVATLTCNFAKPQAGQIATFSHDEVLTLFHEFGHCLHHLLTQINEISASGIHGVEWDAVELPSQFFENWCYDSEALTLLSRHVETQAPLPKELLNKLLAAKNFQSAMRMMRQLEFALFDFRIHLEYQQEPNFIKNILNQVRAQVTVVPIAPENAFEHSFSHIFAGGYAAGYYSYKWAEVLSYDAFSRFEEEGVFNPKTGRDFLRNILEVGGSVKAREAFIAFRGREAHVEALLRHEGII